MSELSTQYPSLAIFADIDWPTVTAEFAPYQAQISFPEYLQIKAENGDCPPYLYELAFYEMALSAVQDTELVLPEGPGVHLNPSAAFLSLQFDLNRMLSDAEDGKIEVHLRDNVLCLYQHGQEIHVVELDQDTLEFLQELEEGPLPLEDAPEELDDLLEMGLISIRR